jgi:hypothetical protein
VRTVGEVCLVVPSVEKVPCEPSGRNNKIPGILLVKVSLPEGASLGPDPSWKHLTTMTPPKGALCLLVVKVLVSPPETSLSSIFIPKLPDTYTLEYTFFARKLLVS